MRIFNRYWELIFEENKTNPVSFTIKPNEAGESLRVQFEINVAYDIRFYSGVVKIYNLSEEKRNRLSYNLLGDKLGTGPKIQFRAGYKERHAIILNGAIFRGWSTKSGGDWITTVWINAPLNTNFVVTVPEKPVDNESLFSVLFSAVNQIKKQPGRIGIANGKGYEENFKRAIDEYLANGNVKNKSISYSGTFSSVIKDIEDEYNLKFFIDTDGWNVIGLKYDTGSSEKIPPRIPDDNEVPEITLSPSNGLLGSPTPTDTGTKIISYLRPGMRLFQYIGIKTKTLSKNISITEIIHKGDTHTDEWYSEIDGISLNQFIAKQKGA